MHNLRLLPLSVLGGIILCTSAAIAQNAAPAARIVNPIDESQLVTLSGTVHPLANARNDRGAVPDNLQLQRMHLVLKRSGQQEAALRQLINDMHTPGTASYHKWLTPDQFGAQFGPSDQDVAAVTAWLSSHGFSVTKVSPGKQTIEFSGNAAQLRSAFHTQIHRYQVNGETHYANAKDPLIPAALASVVSGFASLNNFRFKNYNHYLGRATYDPKADKATPQWTIGSGNATGFNFVLAPKDFAVQYDLPNSALNPAYSGATYDGAGQTIAIINDANINLDLSNQFRQVFLPAKYANNPVQVIIDGNDPGADGINNPGGPNYDSSETYIDVEWSAAVAPAATIDLVVAADTQLENGLELAIEHAVYSNVAPVMSLSFGLCEADLTIFNQYFNQMWEEAAAQGITVMVSTGDAGSAVCDNPDAAAYAIDGQAVSGFASTPYNVAVGGTDFYYSKYNQGQSAINTQLGTYWNTTATNSTPGLSIKGVIPEQPWNDSQFGLNIFSRYADTGSTTMAGGSGGPSTAAVCPGNVFDSSGNCTATPTGYPKPSWQTAAASIGVPADGVRDIPDVFLFAANGQNDSYYPVCYNDGDCQPASSATNGYVQISGFGGTSVASPAFAGIMALVNQKYGPQGQADFVLYPLAKQFPAAFHDVTVGTNSMPCSYSATPADNSPDCIAVTNPIVLGGVTEGQIGTGTTPEYNAGTGYDLASGIGTVDASVLVADWNKVTFKSSSMTLTPSLTSFAHGTPITIGGTVTASSPSGSVALMTNSTENNQQGQGLAPVLTGFDYGAGVPFGTSTFPVQSDGSFTGDVSTLPGGTYQIWGSYSGDGTNAMTTSTPVQITVSPEASGIDFQAFTPNGNASGGQSIGTVDYGTQFGLSAQIAPNSQLSAFESCTSNCPIFTLPTGTVTFKDGSTSINTAVVNAEGDAEYNAPFALGNHTVTASYSGDSSYNSSTSSAITFTIAQDTPALLIGVSNGTLNGNGTVLQIVGGTGQPSLISMIVENGAQFNSGSQSAVSPPTGSVKATGTLPPGMNSSATLVAGIDPSTGGQVGIANFAIPASTTTGNYNLSLNYLGDTNYTSASSGTFQIQVVGQPGLAATTTTATMSGTISPNSNILITGTVTGSGSKAPTGVVDLYSSGTYDGEYSLTVPTSGNASTFSFTVNSRVLLLGANFIVIQYLGDTTYAASAATLNAGNPVANPLSDFTMVSETGIVPINVSGGANSGTVTIDLASTNGFSGNVALTCTAAVGVSCSIPPTAGLSSGGSAAVMLTVNAGTYAANGSYNVLVTGTDPTGEFIHTAAIQAMVSGSPAGSKSYVLTNSGNPIFVAGATTGDTSTITVTPVGKFTGIVDLACHLTNPPGGITPPTCSIPNSVTISSGAVTAGLTINTSIATTPGQYTFTVTGTSGAIAPATVVMVTVNVPPSFTLSNSGSISVGAGAILGNTSTIIVTPTSGFTGSVDLSCAVTPTGANSPTCSVSSPVDITGATAQMATLTVNTTISTPTRAYTATVTGVSAGFTKTTTVTINVGSAVNFALSNSGSLALNPGVNSGNTATVTVTPANGFTGNVDLSCAVTPTGANSPTCSVSSPVDITGATAQMATLTATTTSTTTLGTYTITVTGVSGPITQSTQVTVTVTAPPSFALTNGGSISVSPGATSGNSSTITVTPSNGFTGMVNLTCSITPTAASDPASCSFATPSVNITGATPQTDVLTITTTAASNAKAEPLKLFWPSTGGAALALLLFFAVPRRRRNWLMMIGLLVLFVSGAAIGCGGGGGGGGGTTPPSNPGTTAGNYVITVTGTYGSLMPTTTVNLTVQ